jgi:hypothetical protein
MLGDNYHLRKRLRVDGKSAQAEILAVKERPWANSRGDFFGAVVYKLTLKVMVRHHPFEVTITDEWWDAGHPVVGKIIPVLYDPEHQDKVVIDSKAVATHDRQFRK